MSDHRSLAARIEDAVRAGERHVVIHKSAAVGKTEQIIRFMQLPWAHVPMQHQAGWQPPIITR